MVQLFELMPKNGRKSFYGKAIVMIDDNGDQILYSYGTKIMIKLAKNGLYKRFYDDWTTTTGNHIKSFSGLNKQEYMALELI